MCLCVLVPYSGCNLPAHTTCVAFLLACRRCRSNSMIYRSPFSLPAPSAYVTHKMINYNALCTTRHRDAALQQTCRHKRRHVTEDTSDEIFSNKIFLQFLAKLKLAEVVEAVLSRNSGYSVAILHDTPVAHST